MKATILHNSREFWWSALTSDLSVKCAVIIAAALVVTVVCAVVLTRTGRVAKRRVPLWADADGTATIEFALTLPVLLFMVLTLAQTTFVMGGNLVVHYSAFAAARSAIVQVPADYPDASPNTCPQGSEKFNKILATAEYALVPVSGPAGSSGGTLSPEPYVSALNTFFSAYGSAPPNWVSQLAGERLTYASGNTTIEVLEAVAVDSQTSEMRDPTNGVFRPKAAIGVRVHHNFHLSMPYSNLMWADGMGADGRERYMKISAHAVLTNEGVLDVMPPDPAIYSVPRNDPNPF